MKPQSSILIVDDDDIFRELLASFFADADFKVHTAINGNDAFSVFLKEKPDVVITDVIMPIENGIDFAKKVIATGTKVPIIFISGYTSNKDLLEIKNSECWAGIFAKPFVENELLQHVHLKLEEFKKNKTSN